MTNLLKKNNKAKWEGLKCPHGPIREDQIFPFCFYISENLPVLLFIPPICFLFLGGFPILLFNLPNLLFYSPDLLFYYSLFAFLLPTNTLIIKRFPAAYFLILSYMYIIENNSLPTFRWGGYPEPGGGSRPVRWGDEEENEVRGRGSRHGAECREITRPCTPKHGTGEHLTLN